MSPILRACLRLVVHSLTRFEDGNIGAFGYEDHIRLLFPLGREILFEALSKLPHFDADNVVLGWIVIGLTAENRAPDQLLPQFLGPILHRKVTNVEQQLSQARRTLEAMTSSDLLDDVPTVVYTRRTWRGSCGHTG